MKKSIYFILVLIIIVLYIIGELVITSMLPNIDSLEVAKLELQYRGILFKIIISLFIFSLVIYQYFAYKLYKNKLNNLLVISNFVVEVGFIIYIINYDSDFSLILLFIVITYFFVISKLLEKSYKKLAN